MIPQEFRQRIGNTDIALSMFEDAAGSWAKRWPHVVRVRVEFADGVATFLTPNDFRGLPQSDQKLIYSAPSTARPPTLEGDV